MKLPGIATGYTSESLFSLFSLPRIHPLRASRSGGAAPLFPPLSPAPPSIPHWRPALAHGPPDVLDMQWTELGAWSAMAYGLHGAGRGGCSLPNFRVRWCRVSLARGQAAGAASTARGQAAGTAPVACVAVRPSAAPTAALTHGSRPACAVSTRAYGPPA